jgi:hypothetical protein
VSGPLPPPACGAMVSKEELSLLRISLFVPFPFN